MINVIGYHTTKFGEQWNKSLFDLISEAIHGVIKEMKIDKEEINAVFFGNMLAGILENNVHGGSKISEILKTHVPMYRVEAACASGGLAFNLACQYLNANKNSTVLVVGGEKMTDYPTPKVITALSAAASGEEQEAGLTFPGLYAMLARIYLHTYGYTEEHLAAVSVKNHFHGTFNDKAQFQKEISIEDVLKSPYIADPLKVLDASPISDGASAILVTNNRHIAHRIDKKMTVLSSQAATDSISLSGRAYLDRLDSTVQAGNKAFSDAKLSPIDISVAEVHDCFSIAEILAMEDLGFFKKGEGGERMKNYETMFGKTNGLVVNTSGGLKASGHPVGATGVKQIGEVFLQLTQQAGKRQVKKIKYGLTHNVGGSGGTAVVNIFSS
ncbi:hypothetical protein A2957_01250 [Candidatus Roizmanbacteria bacterium RIFCSPLOWO2_01_FULL_38_11]|uniref:Acetyl-CoA acetyltransferase n=1 Tax=Candidatus Roizmanbacteria bacterium RIFCSPLOWO2_01_FULL_38_11 TaxID=1802060 RepID=A0A1F7IL41_9BACT|nr:MAG: hypothetical protein A2957_01250 [Candidatus Roizmanbacteria bacterium RIFCSPLOWO2_01_FULL_38_11]